MKNRIVLLSIFFLYGAMLGMEKQLLISDKQKKPSRQMCKREEERKRREEVSKKSKEVLQRYFGVLLQENDVPRLLTCSGVIDQVIVRDKMAYLVDEMIEKNIVEHVIVSYIVIDVIDFVKRKLVIHNCKNNFIKELVLDNTIHMPHYQWFAGLQNNEKQKEIRLLRSDNKCIISSQYNSDGALSISIGMYDDVRSFYKNVVFCLGLDRLHAMFFNSIGTKFFLILSNGTIQTRHVFNGRLASGGIRRWSNSRKNASLKGISFSPDWRLFITLSHNTKNSVKMWDSESGAYVTSFFRDSAIDAVSFSPDMRYLIADAGGIKKIAELFDNGEKNSIENIVKHIVAAQQAIAWCRVVRANMLVDKKEKQVLQKYKDIVHDMVEKSAFGDTERMLFNLAMKPIVTKEATKIVQ